MSFSAFLNLILGTSNIKDIINFNQIIPIDLYQKSSFRYSSALCAPSSLAMVPGSQEQGRDFGAGTDVFISTLIVLYLMAVVFLVRRPIRQVESTGETKTDFQSGFLRKRNFLPGIVKTAFNFQVFVSWMGLVKAVTMYPY